MNDKKTKINLNINKNKTKKTQRKQIRFIQIYSWKNQRGYHCYILLYVDQFVHDVYVKNDKYKKHSKSKLKKDQDDLNGKFWNGS